jgi:hypothetical protein
MKKNGKVSQKLLQKAKYAYIIHVVKDLQLCK